MRSRSVRSFTMIVVLALLLAACGDAAPPNGSPSTGDPAPPPGSASGVAQKGPFEEGGSATLYELDAFGARTGEAESTSLLVNGAFLIDDAPWSGITEIVANGTFFDEVQGDVAADTLTLRAVTLADDGFAANVNVFTHVMAARILALLDDGDTFAEAHETAVGEMRAAFGVTGSPNDLNLLQADADGSIDNGALLAFSVAALLAGLDQDDLDALADDFADGGFIDGEGEDVLAAIRAAVADGFEEALESARSNLETRYGVTPPSFFGSISFGGTECDFLGWFSNDLICDGRELIVAMEADSSKVLRLEVRVTGTYELDVLFGDSTSTTRSVRAYASLDDSGRPTDGIGSADASAGGSFAEGLITSRLVAGRTYYLWLRNLGAGAVDFDVLVRRRADGAITEPLLLQAGVPFEGVGGRLWPSIADLKDSYYTVDGTGSFVVTLDGYPCEAGPFGDGAFIRLYAGTTPGLAFDSAPVASSAVVDACEQQVAYTLSSGRLFIKIENRHDLQAEVLGYPVGGISYTVLVDRP